MSALDLKALDDQARAELLMHPERWPDDPALQAELAELLELHLALEAHGEALREAAAPQRSWIRQAWMPAAAALLIGLVPATLFLRNHRETERLQKDRTRIDLQARARAQERAWAAFFRQSGQLIDQFAKHPNLCAEDGRAKDHEDRSAERAEAQTLLEVSHQLAAQGTHIPEAESIRQDLHQWLSELALEDACMDPRRAAELRQWAAARDLSDMANRFAQGEARPAVEAR
jgi:uncharacterized membrane-anchored protein YhcB (DUF1043 family)